MDLVAVKWGVNSELEKSPDQYRDEEWQYIHSMGQDAFKKGKFNERKAIEISKLLADNDLSSNPEIEVNIFEDYWLLSCRGIKNGLSSTPLSEISKDSFLECWNSVSSRKEFQNCISPLLFKQ